MKDVFDATHVDFAGEAGADVAPMDLTQFQTCGILVNFPSWW